ncbi:hypothetical protein IU501_33145 [Nocardia otitidiscaviarum]|uniref:hypothetical protein n=1 Tax=Nocardia otitidiscaviarum TaxID=1823 RepID=UPI0004A716EB|nr:hypothetical protein [Nocardia otitidiscaviarum]MBF6137819.1 hypothetical protein [Nocardia otitidiscaviarum]MBF6485342.1 hypothetical protein [Nocardia otitidiscaviarum]
MITTAPTAAHHAGTATDHNEDVGTLITLKEWADQRGRSYGSIRNNWVGQPGFPAPKQPRSRTGMGGGTLAQEYDSDELDAFAEVWEAANRPQSFPMPDGPDEFRTLGAIARLLGVAGKTVTQYRETFDEKVEHEDRGARTVYRTRGVVDVLNKRRGRGLPLGPRLRRSTEE